MPNTITIEQDGKVRVERTAVVFEGDLEALDAEMAAMNEKVADYDKRIAEIEALRAPLVAALAEKEALRDEITAKAVVEGKVVEKRQDGLEGEVL